MSMYVAFSIKQRSRSSDFYFKIPFNNTKLKLQNLKLQDL